MRLRCLFYTKSHLVLYREVDWNPERIEDADIHMPSSMGFLRIGHTKTLTDPVTGQRRLEDTKLVKQARALGVDEHVLVSITEHYRGMKATDNKEVRVGAGMANAALNLVPGLTKGSDAGDFLTQLRKRTGGGKYELEGTDLLRLIKPDIEEDVVGVRPLSGINYTWITLKIMLMWKVMEDRLSEARNRLYIQAYEGSWRRGEQKRVQLTSLALQERDDECLKIMAQSIKELNLAFGASFFWDNNRSLASQLKWGIAG